METVIEVENLRKTYGATVAADGISFSVGRGEIFGLLGRNGAGKTTAVECVQGLRHPDSGHIRVLGLDPQTDIHRLRPRIGSQLQESALPDRMKVWEALDLFASFAPKKSGPGRSDWRTLLEQWGLVEKQKSSFASLSGGQRQRLFVALALVNDPEIVFLDEMTTGLDPAARRTAWELIRQIRDRGTTVVLVTPFIDEAEQLCDRVGILDHGRVIATGSPRELVGAQAGEVRVSFSLDDGWAEEGDSSLDWLVDSPHVSGVTRRGNRVEVLGEGPVLAVVGAALVQHGLLPVDLTADRPSLEDVFLALTGEGED